MSTDHRHSSKPVPATEYALQLGVVPGTFHRWAQTGRIPAFRVGSRWYVVPKDVVHEIARSRGLFAKPETSSTYRQLQDRLRADGFGKETPAKESESKPNEDRLRIVTVTELAEVLKLSPHTIYRMAKADKIPSMSVGRSWRFDLDAVLLHLQQPKDLWEQSGRSWAAKRRTTRPRPQ